MWHKSLESRDDTRSSIGDVDPMETIVVAHRRLTCIVYCLTKSAPLPNLSLAIIEQHFHAYGLPAALREYLDHCTLNESTLTVPVHTLTHFDIFTVVSLVIPLVLGVINSFLDRIWCTPAAVPCILPNFGKTSSFDTVLVWNPPGTFRALLLVYNKN